MIHDKNHHGDLLREIKKISREVLEEGVYSDEEVKEIILGIVLKRTQNGFLTLGEKHQIINQVFNSLRRLDILQPLLDNPAVTEIMVNGPGTIFVEQNGKMRQLEGSFESSQCLEDVIQSIVGKVNRTVNEAHPIVDARLKDGSRVSVVLAPVALEGPILTIRKFPGKPLTMEQLIQNHTLSEEAALVLERLVQARYNIFISGGTSSGKTTLLNALSNYIPREERIITIEDTAELHLIDKPNLVRLETRNANTQKEGIITVRDLIKTSLRMRPDRIIVGEVRGEEALDMLQAMNTGHDGSISTGHGNSTGDMLVRLETMILSTAALPLQAVRRQISSALEIIIHLARLRDKTRRVMEISEISGCDNNGIILNPLFVFQEKEGSSPERVLGTLIKTANSLQRRNKFFLAGVEAGF